MRGNTNNINQQQLLRDNNQNSTKNPAENTEIANNSKPLDASAALTVAFTHLIPANYHEQVYHAYWPNEQIQMSYDTETDVQEL